MSVGCVRHKRWPLLLLITAAMAVWGTSEGVRAQGTKGNAEMPNFGAPLGKAGQKSRKADQKTPRGKGEAAAPLPKEIIEADVSTRTIAVTSAFTGTEIVVFGSVVNSRQPSAEAGYYDVIVVLEGMPTPLTARLKSNVAGLWVNTSSVDFESVPSYYAIASTRPIEEIAENVLLEQHAIGHDFARLAPAARSVIATQPGELASFRKAVIRLKQKEGLYIKEDYAVIFIGKGLFRSSISLPANVPVGPLTARIYLFREGELLSTFQSRVKLEREGIELWIYRFAMREPVLYGLMAVALAMLAGVAASAAFRRRDAG